MLNRICRRLSPLFLIVLVALPASLGTAMAEEETHATQAISTSLANAKAGSWIRHFSQGGDSYTNYVVAADEESVTLQQIYQYHHHVRESKTLVLSRAEIEQAPIDANASDAQPAEITVKGQTYQTRAVRRPLNDSYATFYITDAIPVTGILRVDVEPASGHSPITLLNDSFGLAPDDLIESAMDAEKKDE